MWMLVSYYLPGKRAPHPYAHLAYGPTLRAEVEEHHLTPPARRVGGRLSKGFHSLYSHIPQNKHFSFPFWESQRSERGGGGGQAGWEKIPTLAEN